jgi:pimeloyl-ACP methyl ester carboxylesterase
VAARGADRHGRAEAPLTPVVLAGSGHWVPEAQPAALAERLRSVLP